MTAQSVNAGLVRSIRTDDKQMNHITLKMGQSTVLRFNDDRPKKVVIGNQNYYNIEFVEGTSDVTLQPLQAIATNLFVYCDKKNYGFLIKTKNHGQYDDLVNVYWKEPPRAVKLKGKVLVSSKKKVRRIKNLINLDRIKVSNFAVTSYKEKKSIFVDFLIRNAFKEDQNLKEINVFATRRGKKLKNQTFVIEKSKLSIGEKTRSRLIIAMDRKKGFTLNISLGKEFGKTIISKKVLK